MPELRQDPSVEKKRPKLPQPDGVDLESFGREPTKPKEKTLDKGDDRSKQTPSRPPAKTPGAFERPQNEAFDLDDSIIDDALSGLDFSLRDPQAAERDPSLILDLENPLTEEEIALSKSLIKGERDVTTRPGRPDRLETGPKIEVAEGMVVQEHTNRSAAEGPPRAPAGHAASRQQRPPALPPSTPRAGRSAAQPIAQTAAQLAARSSGGATGYAPKDAGPRVGSRLSALAAVIVFGAAAIVALMGSFTAVAGWICVVGAAIIGAGIALPRLGWKMELLHVIAAGAAVASTQPWALDLAQIGQTSFWLAPAAMACVGALIVAATLAITALEGRGPASD